MTDVAWEALQKIGSGAGLFLLIGLAITLIISFFIHDIVNAIVMILFAGVNHFLFSGFLDGINMTNNEEIINSASLYIAIIFGLWVMARMFPTCRADYEYTGTYLIYGTLVDEYVDTNVGRFTSNLVFSGIIGVVIYFITNACLSNGLIWVVTLGFPIFQALICVIGIVKSFLY